jgi:GAF domain-containing protein
MTVDPSPLAVTDALERLAALELRNQSMESVLQTVVDLAVQVLPAARESSITLLVDGRPHTPVSSGRLALELDEVQYGLGMGPCLHSASTGEFVEIPDTGTEPRWAEYCRAAAARGNGSSFSVPLPVQDRVSGAMNVYAGAPHAFDEAARSAATRFAPYVAVAVSNVQAYQSARETAANLQVALESRATIEQAKGILMERHRLTPDQAFQALVMVSMRSNTKVRDIADRLVRTGEFVMPPV